VVAGLTIVRKTDGREKVEKKATSLDLLVQQGAFEVTRQQVLAGKYFFLDAASDWEGFEFIYLLSGSLRVTDDDTLLHAGDYMYHHGLPQRAHFQVERDVEFLLLSSPPSFHLMRDEIQEILQLARSVEEKDEVTEGHCHRLERLAVATGERLNLRAEQLVTLSYAAYLHDVGKVKVPDEILNKPGPLTDEEWVEMRKHPDYGAQILEDKEFLRDAARIVRAHHERYDGSGYPRGLCGDDIPIEARIIAVVDAYDAMVSDRPYRKALSKETALGELQKNLGSQFDPQVVRAFLLVIGESAGDTNVA
jgi:putative nucleotidyltransferase with HDIG domain